jgi:hypothetical protein
VSDDFLVPDEPAADVRAAFERATRRGVTRPPTNAELAERAKEKTDFEIVLFWLRQHVRPPHSGQPIDEWMEWAAQNFLADPEVQAWLSIIAQRNYQRGFEDGRAAEGKLASSGDPGEPYESEQEAAFWRRYRERHPDAGVAEAVVRDVALNLLRVGRLNELDAYLRGVIPAPELRDG